MCYFNFAQVLSIHTRFDDLDLISRSQVCQIRKLQVVFRFLSTCLVPAHIKKIKHSMLHVTVVFLRDITNTISVILHLNVNHLSICSSCVSFKYRITEIVLVQKGI